MSFSKKFLEEMKDKLLKMKELSLASIKQMESESFDEDIKDDGDAAQAMADLTLKKNMIERERQKLKKVERALLSINEGSYGYCIDTEEPISETRLKANPFALRTVEAQELFEKQVKKG